MAEKRYWLLKSEPESFSFEHLMKEPNRTAHWDGVRNYQARNFIRDEMQKGDGVLFYHSSTAVPAVVGTASIVKAGYPDHTAWDPKSDHPDPKSTPDKPLWYMVDIKGEAALKHPVTLTQIKATPALAKMSLFTRPRLSVHPVTKDEWDTIMEMSKKGA
ncbi:MAG: EVE domain-containing protein [SAR202 cluster bacterium]|nr:EVE domain-containing protein [SAR202 cluster bacterium]